MRTCAIRECFEETGVLLTRSIKPQSSVLETARHNIHTGRKTFAQFLQAHSMTASEEDLLPFTTWITPATMPKRFENKFFLAFLNDEQSTGPKSRPTPDGGTETVAADFFHPKDALLSFQRQEISLYPPQFYLLSVIKTCIQLADPEHGLRNYSRNEGEIVFDPEPIRNALDDRVVLALHGDEARDGGVKGGRNRILLRTSKGAPQSIELIQNVAPINSKL